jgi:hypothetical protein
VRSVIPPNPKAWAIREGLRIKPLEGFYRACAAGADSRCPFCLAILAPSLDEGDRLLALSDFMAGGTGRVVPTPENLRGVLKPWTVFVKFKGTPRGQLTMLDQGRYLAVRLPAPRRPQWFPPLPLRLAGDCHAELLRFCSAQSVSEPCWDDFSWLIASIWRARLPLEGDEMVEMLRAHGIPHEVSAELGRFFGHGRNLLVVAAGRRPVKKFRTDYRPLRKPINRRPLP